MKVNVIAAGWVLAFLLGFDMSSSLGSTVYVTSTNDAGSGSLRQAINDAASGDTLVLSVQGVVTLTNGELLIAKNLTLKGPGAGGLAINGNGGSRVFHITNGVTVTLSGLTITNGVAPAGVKDTDHSNGEPGGGILNFGVLTVDSCVIAGNKAGVGASNAGGNGGDGGGVYNTGVLSLTASTIYNNRGGDGGKGGLRSDLTLSIGGNGGDGGGIYSEGTLSMTNATVSGNSGGLGGGGAGVTNRVSGGGAGGHGGGVCSLGFSSLVNCTITGNQGGSGGAGGTNTAGGRGISGSGGSGGGLYSPTNLFRVLNTLISSNNVPTNGLGRDVSGTFVSLGHNLVGINEANGFGVTGDILGTAAAPLNAWVASLADNGGNTPTCALLAPSPALDAGWDVVLSAPWSIRNDQRGVPRKLGLHCDIGAFEFSSTTPQYTLTLKTNGPGNIVVSPAAGPYFSNTFVTLAVAPQPSAVFDGWSGDVSGSNVTNSFWITSNMVVEADFHGIVLLTLSTPGGGAVQSSTTTNRLPSNTPVTLSATPSNGWSFIHWTGDVTSVAPVITIVMDSNKTIQAVFGTPVNSTVIGNGAVLAVPELSLYPYGIGVSLYARADVGSVFSRWERDGILTTNPVLSLVVTSAQPSVVARFQAASSAKVWVVGGTNDSGSGSLRGAVGNAASGDVIQLTATGVISLTNGEIVIDKNLVVTGPGAALLSINANRLSRIFNIRPNATVSLSGLTVTNGKSGFDTQINGLPGGGILNAGALTLDACSIQGNITSAGGALTVCGNGGDGAGICNQGTLIMNGCLIAGNYCGAGGAVVAFKGLSQGGKGGSGGGIYNSGLLRVKNTTIQGNTAGHGGAGPIGQDVDPSLLLGGDGGNGGGILNISSAAIVNTTINGNWSGAGGNAGISFGSNYVTGTSGASGLGGGIHSISNAVTILNTLIAGNRSEIDLTSTDVTGVINSLGHNLVGLRGSDNLGLGAEGDLLGTAENPVDPMLDSLADNGGPVFTCALLAGSPAIDAGDDAVLASPWDLLVDACGMIRIAGAHVDMGAYEFGGTTNIPPQLDISMSGAGQSVQLLLKGNPAKAFDIVVSTNLVQWTRLTTVTNVYGSLIFPVPATPLHLQLFRAKELP